VTVEASPVQDADPTEASPVPSAEPTEASPLATAAGNVVNRLEVTCAGTTIAASANGTLLGSVQDETYREGWFQISVLATVSDLAPGEEVVVRLDNLVIAQR
jgi:hypothetical protein